MAKGISIPLAGKIVGITGLLVSVVLAVLTVLTGINTSEHVFETEEHNLEQMADIIKDLLDTEINALLEASELMSEHTELIEHIIDKDNKLLEEYIEHEFEKLDFYDEIFITDKDGYVINNHPNDEMIGENVKEHEEYEHAWKAVTKNTDKTFLDSDVYKSEVSGNPAFLISSAIMHDGEFLGSFVTVIDSTEFYNHYLADKVFAKNGYAIIADNSGIMVAHPDKSVILTDQSHQEYMSKTKAMIESGNEHGLVEYMYQGKKKFLRYDTLDKVPWHVSLTVYDEDLRALASVLIRNMVTIGGISLIVLIILITIVTIIFVSKPINKVVVQLTEGSNNLESASQQIAASSQQLSSGNSELAASIEEITSSLEELQSVIELNTKNINESELLMKETNSNSQKVSNDMSDLSGALDDIGSNSEEIVNIIAVIEDIAFQTNILALNAAVEAGRAGEAGSGFAVVADQVKELAQKSSESAKETAKLIKKAIDSISKGQDIGNSVKEAQQKTSEMSTNVTTLLNEVNRASKEQMKGVNQITQAITQTNSVVQQTAASAEETAAASEELLGQSEDVNDVVDNLNIVVKGKANREGRETKKEVKKVHKNNPAIQKKTVTVNKDDSNYNPDDIIPMNDEFKEF